MSFEYNTTSFFTGPKINHKLNLFKIITIILLYVIQSSVMTFANNFTYWYVDSIITLVLTPLFCISIIKFAHKTNFGKEYPYHYWVHQISLIDMPFLLVLSVFVVSFNFRIGISVLILLFSIDLIYSFLININNDNRKIELDVGSDHIKISHHFSIPYIPKIIDYSIVANENSTIKALFAKVIDVPGNIFRKNLFLKCVNIEDEVKEKNDDESTISEKYFLYFFKKYDIDERIEIGILADVYTNFKEGKLAISKIQSINKFELLYTTNEIIENQSGIIKI